MRVLTKSSERSLLCLTLITGCTTYRRNNNPTANSNTDLYECTKAHSTTITSGGGTGLIGAANTTEVESVRTDYAMRDLCLKSRGWYQILSQVLPHHGLSQFHKTNDVQSEGGLPFWSVLE